MKRREFIELAALAGVGAPLLFGSWTSKHKKIENPRIACIGVSGMGWGDIQKLQGENVVALCDVDSNSFKKGKELYPNAKTYSDFRVMLRELRDDIDAVTISTPDHTHFPIAMMALQMGKHVYLQKPLAHTINEVRQLMGEAKKQKVHTQMGNQAHAWDQTRVIREWYEAGLIGELKEVIAWTDRPKKGYGFIPEQMEIPTAEAIPDTLDWDGWVGPVPNAPPYASKYYHTRNWRGWWQFGVGGLGDIGCHTIDTPFWALDLEVPKKIEVKMDHVNPLFTPSGSVVSYTFEQRKTGKLIPLTWYEGPEKPEAPEMVKGMELPASGGLMIVGSKGIIYHEGMRPDKPRLFPDELWKEVQEKPELAPQKYPRIKGNHIQEWLRAIKQEGPKPGSSFDYAGPLTESIILGSLAIRTGKAIDYNPKTMTITNNEEANNLLDIPARKGFRLEDLKV